MECRKYSWSSLRGSVSFISQSRLILSLADPVRQLPEVFGNSQFFTRFPYALPNLFIASIILFSCLLAFLFVNETLHSNKHEADLGTRLRLLIRRKFQHCIRIFSREKVFNSRIRGSSGYSELAEFSSDENQSFSEEGHELGNEETRPASSTDPGPSASYQSSFLAIVRRNGSQRPSQFKDIFTQQIVLNMIVYSGLMLQTVSFDQVFPLLCSTRVEDGGMGMTAGQISAAIAVAGVIALVLQIIIFPWGHNKFGGLFCLRVVLGMFPTLYIVQIPLFSNKINNSVFRFYRS